ncbi:MAG: hypothetical protein OJF47_002676 [Nitrospira sp.]|jgi:hypothetical protein|nr:MAG: hypothetical protein OJF47_002676 [Nitrospira sp.]
MVGGFRQRAAQNRRVNLTARLTEMNRVGGNRFGGELDPYAHADVDGLWTTCV